MRTLIDGYNLMFAGGLIGRRHGPDGLRKVRQRFLNDLAATLGPTEAHLTTVVFDAAPDTAPPDVPSSTRHKGLTVLYAVDVDTADERIEGLIAQHSSPKRLTVVSSDHRIQRAAARRKARVVSADEYWTRMDSRKERKANPPPIEDHPRSAAPSAGEAAFWLEEFRELADSDEARAAFARDPIFPSDEEIARIEREVEDEFRRR